MKYLVLLLLIVPTVVFAQDFVSLTQIPQIQSLAQENNLAGLLNYVYLICIGIGASLAVFQFVRAGILYSSNTGSQSKVSEAKKMIGDTVFGLVLLLSPFVVFSLIDPRALDLSLNFGALRIENTTPPAPLTPQEIQQGLQAVGSGQYVNSGYSFPVTAGKYVIVMGLDGPPLAGPPLIEAEECREYIVREYATQAECIAWREFARSSYISLGVLNDVSDPNDTGLGWSASVNSNSTANNTTGSCTPFTCTIITPVNCVLQPDSELLFFVSSDESGGMCRPD